MDQDLAILTPEKTILSYRLAGLGSRISAHLIDLLILGALMFGSAFGIFFVFSRIDEGLATGVLIAFLSASPFIYFICFEGFWNGQTLGKRVMGIRVRMLDGTPITMVAAIGRNFLRPADMLPGPYFLGIVSMFLNARSQRIGDLVAGTVVCYEQRAVAAFAPAPHMMGIHPLESHIGDVRNMTPEEYQALRRMCDRFPEFANAIQDRMIREVWTPIAEKLHVSAVPNVHPIYLAEAVVMKYGRQHGLL